VKRRGNPAQAWVLALAAATMCAVGQFSGSCLSFAGGGGALGEIVYDPTNHAENAVTAAQAVKQTINQVKAYALQLQQYLAELENLKKLPAAVIERNLKPYRTELDLVTQLHQELSSAHRDLQRLGAEFQQRLRQMAVLGMAPKDYLEHEIALASRQGRSLEAAFKSSIDTLHSVNDSFQRIRDLQGQISQSAGVQQSLQTLNQHLNLLAGQNAQLLGLLASSEARVSARQKADADTSAGSADYQKRRFEEDEQAVKRIRDELRRQERANGWGIMSD
jgi:type IV secretion system protein TrbJ